MGPHIEDSNPVVALLRLREFLRDKLHDRGFTSAPSTFKADGFATTFGLNYFCNGTGNPLMAPECAVSAGVSARSLVGQRSSIAITIPL